MLRRTLSLGCRAVTLLVPFAASGRTPIPASTRDLVPVTYNLSVRVEPVAGRFSAGARLLFREGAAGRAGPADTLVFLLHGELRVDSLRVGGVPVSYTQERRFYRLDYSLIANEIRVPLEGHSLAGGMTLHYGGPVNPSRARSPSDYMRIDDSGVFLRGHGYSPWYPLFGNREMNPSPLDVERLVLEVPIGWVGVFAGHLASRDTVDGWERSVWSAPGLSAWDAQLSARRWEVEQVGDVRLYALTDSASQRAAGSILDAARRLDAFYRERYGEGRGAGSALHILQMPPFGDIASGNVIGLSEEQFRGFDLGTFPGRTLAHEMVHAFVQVPTPGEDPVHALVIEGFPSYFHLPAMEYLLGSAFSREWVTGTDSAYVLRRRTGLDRRGNALPREIPLTAIPAADIGVWKDRFVLNDRAPLFLEWLRRRMGDEIFFAWARDLFAMSVLTRAAFENSILQVLGSATQEDLRLWLDTTEYPERFRPVR